MNQEKDRMDIQILDERDVEEFHSLLEGSDDEDLASYDAIDDDVIDVEDPHNLTSDANCVSVGVSPLKVDTELSMEYSYTTDVRYVMISFIRICIHIYLIMSRKIMFVIMFSVTSACNVKLWTL